MTKYVTQEDIPIINKALNSGVDVRIQLTPSGYRIVSDKVVVLKKGTSETQNK